MDNTALKGDEGVNNPPALDITPKGNSLAVGETRQFKAQSSGKVTPITHPKWVSSDPTVLKINANGEARGISEGAVTITATSGNATGTLGLEVIPAQLKSIAVAPANPSLLVGGEQQFTATGLLTDGNTEDPTEATWESSDTSVATIDAGGLATSLKAGPTTITASSGGVSGSTLLTVLQSRW